MQYTWESSHSGNKINIKKDGEKVGGLLFSNSKKRCKASWKGKKFGFKSSVGFTVKVEVEDLDLHEMIAEAKISHFLRKVRLRSQPGEEIRWQYTTFWQRKWKWQNGALTEVLYQAKGLFQNKGIIFLNDSGHIPGYRVPLGLFIKAQMTQ